MAHNQHTPEQGHSLAPQSEEGLYLPFPVARNAGILDVGSVDPHIPSRASLMVRNGMIPDQAGVVELPGNRLAAIDLVDGSITGKDLIITPTSKSAVDTESRLILGQGMVAMTFDDEGIIKLIAMVAPEIKAAWNKDYTAIGRCALRPLGLDASHYEIKDFDLSGTVIAKQPTRYF
ncbi:hypothetical protein KC968_04130 [Candidatus Saccharibacteria bacterium]|nr:hypothetical protein [Candidatus Saccharibacteria bacterium]